MDGDHGLAATGATDHDVRAALAELNTAGPFHQPKHLSARHASTVLDDLMDRTTARNARSRSRHQPAPSGSYERLSRR